MVVKNVELPEYSVLMSVYAGEKPEHLSLIHISEPTRPY